MSEMTAPDVVRCLVRAAYSEGADLEALRPRVLGATDAQLGDVLVGLCAMLRVAATVLAKDAMPLRHASHVRVPAAIGRRVRQAADLAAEAGVLLSLGVDVFEPARDDPEQLLVRRTAAAVRAYSWVGEGQVRLTMDTMSWNEAAEWLHETGRACAWAAQFAQMIADPAGRHNADAAFCIVALHALLNEVGRALGNAWI